jgi:hypothetical protein
LGKAIHLRTAGRDTDKTLYRAVAAECEAKVASVTQSSMSQDNNPPAGAVSAEKEVQEATEKYKELYEYSTDVLLKEQERFNRADEKASKYATMFFFLIGAVAYYDKWIFERLNWDYPCVVFFFYLPLIAAGLLALLLSLIGLFLAHHVIKSRFLKGRPLNQDMLDLFENEARITIYYGLARENSNAYAENKKATDEKYHLLNWAYKVMVTVFVLLVFLSLMYILCMFADKIHG